MIEKIQAKENAINLRKRGLSYSEILRKIPVAKSTLSLWLRKVGLSKRQKQRITKKKLAAALNGAKIRREKRIVITKEIKDKAINEVKKLSVKELWLIGTALYWAEGHKEKNSGSLVRLGNSDPAMIKTFLQWLYQVCEVDKTDLIFRIYLHETARYKLKEVKKYWAGTAGFSKKYFQSITWKKNKIKTNRKNIGKNYYGLLDVSVRRSINLNRKISGWIEGIYKNI